MHGWGFRRLHIIPIFLFQPSIIACRGRKAACRRIGEEHGLSKRELDVFVLLARGYASASIQKKLYIAAGTTNYHTRNIYAKLGVHSRSEVIELVNAKADDG